MNKWEREFIIAELIAELEEQRRFDEFYEKIPNVIIRHKTQESHLPLTFVISNAEGKIDDACSEIIFAIEKADGYFHEDVKPIVEKVKSYWRKTHMS